MLCSFFLWETSPSCMVPRITLAGRQFWCTLLTLDFWPNNCEMFSQRKVERSDDVLVPIWGGSMFVCTSDLNLNFYTISLLRNREVKSLWHCFLKDIESALTLINFAQLTRAKTIPAVCHITGMMDHTGAIFDAVYLIHCHCLISWDLKDVMKQNLQKYVFCNREVIMHFIVPVHPNVHLNIEEIISHHRIISLSTHKDQYL